MSSQHCAVLRVVVYADSAAVAVLLSFDLEELALPTVLICRWILLVGCNAWVHAACHEVEEVYQQDRYGLDYEVAREAPSLMVHAIEGCKCDAVDGEQHCNSEPIYDGDKWYSQDQA